MSHVETRKGLPRIRRPVLQLSGFYGCWTMYDPRVFCPFPSASPTLLRLHEHARTFITRSRGALRAFTPVRSSTTAAVRRSCTAPVAESTRGRVQANHRMDQLQAGPACGQTNRRQYSLTFWQSKLNPTACSV
eukprot:351748-Chlamydomonas_euryale.AAC.4